MPLKNSSFKVSSENLFYFLFFIVLFLHGATVGLSDDEAYYWVLAQNPSFGYAFHPPAVAWLIYFFQKVFGWAFSTPSPGLVRLPTVLCTTWILKESIDWIKSLGNGIDEKFRFGRSISVILSFFGLFSLSWMTVPDIPLYLGWILLFRTTWAVCFNSKKTGAPELVVMVLSSCLLILSKFSGVLAIGSAGLCVLFAAPRAIKIRLLAEITFGFILGMIPILYWNSQHHWVSLLYQLKDRHEGADLSWIRYRRFWAIQIAVAGPLLVGYCFSIIPKFLRAIRFGKPPSNQVYWFAGIWILPPFLVFCLQPLYSDFKLHWAFATWLPGVLVLAWAAQSSAWKWIRYQAYYGLVLGIVILVCCQVPLGPKVYGWATGKIMEPKWDVSNDLYGWDRLREYYIQNLSTLAGLPVVGSRYQTTSQAAFQLQGLTPVSMIPRDLREKDDWPVLDVSEGEGPAWPALKKSILYVADIRYDLPPQYPGAKCSKLTRLETTRAGFLAKWIDLWRCDAG